MKTKINKLMAYVYMPLIFTIVGIIIIYIALNPVIDIVVSASAMVVTDEIPDFSEDLDTAFEQPEVENTEQQVATIPFADIEMPAFGTHYAQIKCERIGLDAPVYMGDSDKILKVGVGQFQGSFIPGYGKPIMLAAHCTTYFAPFEIIQAGDIVTITTNYGVYEYEIFDTKVVEPPFDTAYDLGKEEEELIMYTCYPFKLLSGSRNSRLFVYGKKINGPNIEK